MHRKAQRTEVEGQSFIPTLRLPPFLDLQGSFVYEMATMVSLVMLGVNCATVMFG